MKQTKEQLELLEKAKRDLQAQLKEPKKEMEIDFSLKIDSIEEKPRTIKDIQNSTQIHSTQQPKQKDYFEFVPTTMTPALQKELLIIKNRHVIDPKRHYKRQDKISSKIQFGEIIGGVEDRRQKVKSMTRELLKDEYYKSYVKRRVDEVHTLRNNVTRKGYKKKRK